MSGFDDEIEALSKLSGEPLLAAMYGLSKKCDAAGDPDERVEWLKRMMDVSDREGSFAWDLKVFGELRGLYYSSERFAFLKPDLLWYFKWLVYRVGSYADVPFSTIDALFAEMTDFYASAEESPRPIYAARCRLLVDTGRLEEADPWFERWLATRAGTSDDCAACESGDRIHYYLAREKHDAAFSAAEGILSGQEWCNHTPATLSSLLMASMHTGREDLAFSLHRHGRHYARTTPSGLTALAQHVAFLASTGHLGPARRLVLVGLARAKLSANDRDKFHLYRAAGLWASLATLEGRYEALLFPRSILVESQHPNTPVPLTAVAARCLAEARAYAERLDRRNGNTAYETRLQTTEQWLTAVIQRLSDERRPETSS